MSSNSDTDPNWEQDLRNRINELEDKLKDYKVRIGTTEESLSKELFSARLVPTLLLIVMPFGIGIIMPNLSPVFRFENTLVPAGNIKLLSMYTAWFPGFLGLFMFSDVRSFSWYNLIKNGRYGFVINEYEYINKILYVEFVIIITLTLLFYTLPMPMKKGYLHPLLGDGFYFLQSTLILTVYMMCFKMIPSYIRQDFRFQFAKVCMDIVEHKRKEVNNIGLIYYLMLGLKSYNKFLKRNLKLQFDDIMVCSKIISSSEKNQSIDSITASFKDNDKLKAVICLSNIIKLPDKEQFLVKKRFRGEIKDAITILTAIFPVVISILQLMFPKMLPK